MEYDNVISSKSVQIKINSELEKHSCTNISITTFPDEWSPFQIMRQTTTHDKNRVPTSSHCIPPSPLASPTINVPFSPAFRSIKGWFFCNTRCLEYNMLRIEHISTLKYISKGYLLTPKILQLVSLFCCACEIPFGYDSICLCGPPLSYQLP